MVRLLDSQGHQTQPHLKCLNNLDMCIKFEVDSTYDLLDSETNLKSVDRWMDGRMDGQTDGWTDRSWGWKCNQTKMLQTAKLIG